MILAANLLAAMPGAAFIVALIILAGPSKPLDPVRAADEALEKIWSGPCELDEAVIARC